MNRISMTLRAAAFAASLVTVPALAASPAQEYLDHFTAQAVTAQPAAKSIDNPVEDFLAQLKGETGGYEEGHTARPSNDDPRQDFIMQLSANPLSIHEARDSVAAVR